MRLAHVATALWISIGVAQAAATDDLQRQQADARRQQTELRSRIDGLKKDIEAHESSRRDAASALQASETAISDINRELVELAQRIERAQQQLQAAQTQQKEQQDQLVQRRATLAALLRSHYEAGLSPWTALLSGDDPREIGRELRYLSYITQAQSDAVRAVQAALERLKTLEQTVRDNQAVLKALAEQTQNRKQALDEQRKEREQVLARIESQLREQRSQAQRLEGNEQRLGRLVEGLGQAIAEQRERERLAEQKRRQEQRQREQEQRREEQRREEEQIRQARDRAKQTRAEQEKAQQEQAKQDKAEQERAQQETERRQSDPAAAGAPEGLRQGLPPPVPAQETLGRFGSKRPDGGVWRGIVLLATEGTQVRAVASGRVVYASWLTGFGNILILDHGQQYLSIYGYNQSLLRQVGDTVRRGEVVATVGSTGGQVEPGLYFEIRHRGVPVNPQLWLRR
ncbi:MAG: murein hydrolase activator EnvC [Burkholderiaceae bacterium]